MKEASENQVSQVGRQDAMTGIIVIAAALLFVWTGGKTVAGAVHFLAGDGEGVERLLSTAVLLNVALILFAYRRYRDLRQEVSSLRAAEAQSRKLASTEFLTGFFNRPGFEKAGAELIRRAHPDGKSVVLMMLDLDHFKAVNDLHGHAAGDAMLKIVAERIASTMPDDALLARLGGDEFACACKFEPTEQELIDELAEALVTVIVEPAPHEGTELHVSASLGMARSDRDGETIETLLHRADIAMYAAKTAGRNRHCWFEPGMEKALDHRRELEGGIRAGIAADEFLPYYEQQVDLTTGHLLGFEMLARWNSPALGVVMPDEFIPIAEESGLIGALSFQVMRKAFTDAREWDPSLTLSVNISPTQLRDPWFSQKLLRLLTETGFPPHRLEIELTETSLYDNLPLAQTIVASLKNQGIRIALDDFGTGYNSLAHLRALPFDRIKIDRSFVLAMQHSKDCAAVVQAIARLGESMGLPVTAEGIESGDIERQLQTLGLDKGQGWHFGKPMTVEEARGLLAARDMLGTSEAAPSPADDVPAAPSPRTATYSG